MDDMQAIEQRITRELLRRGGPSEPVDDAAIFAAVTTTQSPTRRFGSMFSATKLVIAGAIVALFGGLLLVGILPPVPDRVAAPAAVGTGEPVSSTDPGPSATPQATDEVYEATARLVVDPGPDPSIEDLAVAEAALLRYASLAESRLVAQAVVNSLKLDESARSLRQRIDASVSEETLEIAIGVRDGSPADSRALALAVGNELISRVRDELITDEVEAVDAAIAADQASVRVLQNRLNQLQRKQSKDVLDRSEIIALTGEISALRRDIQFYQPNSRAFVRNLLQWSERPKVPKQPVRDEGVAGVISTVVGNALDRVQGLTAPERSATDQGSAAVIPTRDVVVAVRRIEQGTSLEREMLTLRTVPVDATNDMALTDVGSALGKVPAIDILPNQIITPNMLEEQ